jgi:hypothetical protein
MCGGGSTAEAAVVNEASGTVDVGADVRRSAYETKESRLVAGLMGEWGEEEGAPRGEIGDPRPSEDGYWRGLRPDETGEDEPVSLGERDAVVDSEWVSVG